MSKIGWHAFNCAADMVSPLFCLVLGATCETLPTWMRVLLFTMGVLGCFYMAAANAWIVYAKGYSDGKEERDEQDHSEH